MVRLWLHKVTQQSTQMSQTNSVVSPGLASTEMDLKLQTLTDCESKLYVLQKGSRSFFFRQGISPELSLCLSRGDHAKRLGIDKVEY